MTLNLAALIAFVLATVGLIGLTLARPKLMTSAGGKVLGFLALFLLPTIATIGGVSSQLESATSTEFCLSCHVMQPYGDSMWRDDTDYLPAGHFQNNLIPPERACYTCHTSYAMFGGLEAKWKGMQHLWVNYLGTIPERPELYEPFANRECLHCHEGGRVFEENESHSDVRSELAVDEISCLECHEWVHEVSTIDDAQRWEGRR